VRAQTLHIIVLLALVGGLAASTFAYFESVYPPLQSACTVNAFISCAKIDTSGRTTTLGLQDYSIGIAGFLLMLGIDLPLYLTWRAPLLRSLLVVSGLGVALSVYWAYIELVEIRGICPVCLTSYLTNLIAFAALVTLVWKARPSPEEPEHAQGPAVGTPPEAGSAAR
jgi:uncharacterized membrane protein